MGDGKKRRIKDDFLVFGLSGRADGDGTVVEMGKMGEEWVLVRVVRERGGGNGVLFWTWEVCCAYSVV